VSPSINLAGPGSLKDKLKKGTLVDMTNVKSLLEASIDLTTLLSIAAIVVSILSMLIARRQGELQSQLQQRLLSLEGARERDRLRAASSAEVQAAIEKRSGDFWLLVRNNGPNEAKAIRVYLDGQPLLSHPLILDGIEEVHHLGPQADARYVLAVTMGVRSVLKVMIQWEDASGESRTWASQLTL
jgi:hypothetical protein